jgi:uncharacterized damage-inducible protein DinB
MAREQIQNYCEQTEKTIERMLQLVIGLGDGRLRKKPGPEAWSVMEVLCHVEEAMVYWMEELQRVTRNKGGEWGRGLQDERRLSAVARADDRTLREVTDGIRNAGEQIKQTLLQLQDEDLSLEAPHRNPKFGTKPMTFLLDHFVVEHLDNHVRQIERTLAAV